MPSRLVHLTAAAALTVSSACGTAATERAAAAFRDVTQASGITFEHGRAEFDPRLTHIMRWLASINAGACAADYDEDGDTDFYLVTSTPDAANALLRYDAGSGFVDVAAFAGVDRVNDEEGLSMTCLFGDVDNDGDQDLFVAAYGRSRLFVNDGGGRFTEQGRRAGLTHLGNVTAALFLDYDGDGWLDLLLGRYYPHDLRQLTTTRILQTSFESADNGGADLLYRNNGDGTFREVSRELGVDQTGWTLALGAGDLDDDGDQDVYVANDYGSDLVYRNNGDGTLTDITASATGGDRASGMNVDFGDFDDDGRLDIYVTNITNAMMRQGNMLWQNLGDLQLMNVARERGVADGGWGWSAKWFDFDHDADLDLYTVNGFVSDGPVDLFRGPGQIFRGDVSDYRGWPDMRGLSLSGHERKRLFRHDGRRFTEIARDAGVDSRADGRGIALADIEQDGDLDMLVTYMGLPPILYRNEVGQDRPWLQVHLRGATGNRDAIGSRVSVRGQTLRTQIREIDGGNGFSAQSARLAHFGLAGETGPVTIDVRWPNGRRLRYRDVRPRTFAVISEQEGP